MSQIATNFFSKDGGAFLWWEQLDTHNRADRAELRRCHSLGDVYLTQGFHRLVALANRQGLSTKPSDDAEHFTQRTLRALAFFAATTCHVSKNKDGRIGKAFAGGEDHRLSGLRFRRLLECQNLDELLPHFRRGIQIIRTEAPITTIGLDALYFGDKTRQKWASDYYEVAFSEA